MRALAIAALTMVAGAAEAKPTIDLAAERAAIEQYQDIDQRLQDIGWRLARSNAEFCPHTSPSLGLQLQDLASYGDPDIARAALAMQGDFSVQTAADGSPSARSGQFTRNREVTRIGDTDPNGWAVEGSFDWKRLARTHDWIEEQLAASEQLTFSFADGTSSTLSPVRVCATRFEIASDGDMAVADGSRVVFGVEFPGFNYPPEIFAASVAHELSHNLLEHDRWLDANGRKRRNVRRAEREADRLVPWLLANAGYDPANASVFMRTWGPDHDGGIFRKRTHDGWDERVELIEAELPRIRALLANEGKADWSAHFRRDIDPADTGDAARGK